uniref:Uncharacterized protein n=1 Tax=Thermosporothrix sp. COM3 TaxID=2490863 RepID=A0A455SZZ3_9CHLR|nr:hypothetical protein KTC_64660 [Thermosporothrix sp. COM3]
MQTTIVIPFLLHFSEAAPQSQYGDDTIYETVSKTSTDGVIDDDVADDTDLSSEADWDDQTGLIADSGTRDDEDYSRW